jgi:Protein of unknown function (DUF3499)
MRVSGAAGTFSHDSLSIVNVPRRCCRPGCPHYAVATLTFVYSDSTAVIGPLATAREPHSWDLCASHASRITAPRGWELVRHSGPMATNPDEDDLVALADAVREGQDPPPANGWYPDSGPAGSGFPGSPPQAGGDPDGHPAGASATAPGGGVLAQAGERPAGTGRRRGHLRVLPDLGD